MQLIGAGNRPHVKEGRAQINYIIMTYCIRPLLILLSQTFFIFPYRMAQVSENASTENETTMGTGDLSYLEYLQRFCGSHFQARYGSNTSVQSCDDFTVFAFQPSTIL